MKAGLLGLLVLGCGGIAQPAECAKYLTCSEAVQAGSTMNTKLTYGPGGTCWLNGSDAEACREICGLATVALKLGAGRSTPECQ